MDNAASQYSYGYGYGSTDPIKELTEKVDALSSNFGGQINKYGRIVPRSFKDITRGEIADVFKQTKATRKDLPYIFESFLNQVNRGSFDPSEARYAYLDLARSAGVKPRQAYKQADILGSTPMGFASAANYDRYKPAAALAFDQLLGRPIGEQEFKNYVSAAQGLGITKGADFQAFLGETLLSSPEYKSKEVVFNPEKVSGALKTLLSVTPASTNSNSSGGMSVSEYAQMLGGLT
jgi:hypothetical protein